MRQTFFRSPTPLRRTATTACSARRRISRLAMPRPRQSRSTRPRKRAAFRLTCRFQAESSCSRAASTTFSSVLSCVTQQVATKRCRFGSERTAPTFLAATPSTRFRATTQAMSQRGTTLPQWPTTTTSRSSCRRPIPTYQSTIRRHRRAQPGPSRPASF